MRWVRNPDFGGSLAPDLSEWEEHWTVQDFRPPAGEPPWIGMLTDRPEFRIGQPHYDPNITGIVDGFDWDRLSTTRDAWDVVVKYRAEIVREEEEELDPLRRPARITLDAESEEVPIDRDFEGNPILNTAGDLISGLTEEENRWVFRVEVDVPDFPRWIIPYRNAVNQDAVRIKGITVEPGYLLLKQPRIGNPVTETVGRSTVTYYPLSFDLVYHPKNWAKKVFNRGLYEWVEEDVELPPGTVAMNNFDPGTNRRKVRILDDNGDPVDEPQFLDANGRVYRVSVENPETEEKESRMKHPLDPSDIITIEKWTKNRLPFRALPIT